MVGERSTLNNYKHYFAISVYTNVRKSFCTNKIKAMTAFEDFGLEMYFFQFYCQLHKYNNFGFENFKQQ